MVNFKRFLRGNGSLKNFLEALATLTQAVVNFTHARARLTQTVVNFTHAAVNLTIEAFSI